MQLDRHPDAVRVRIIAVPRITEAAVLRDGEERVVREPGRHQDIFIECARIILPKLLHVTGAKNLRVHFQKLVPGVNSAIGFLGRIPEVQLELISPRRRWTCNRMTESCDRIEFYLSDVVLRGNI